MRIAATQLLLLLLPAVHALPHQRPGLAPRGGAIGDVSSTLLSLFRRNLDEGEFDDASGDGSGVPSATVTMPPRDTGMLQVTSGSQYCQIDVNGCATDGAGLYGDNELCTVQVNVAGSLTATEFHIEGASDHVTIGGRRYSGPSNIPSNVPSNVSVAAMSNFDWRSDSDGNAAGWTICLTPSDPAHANGIQQPEFVYTIDPNITCDADTVDTATSLNIPDFCYYGVRNGPDVCEAEAFSELCEYTCGGCHVTLSPTASTANPTANPTVCADAAGDACSGITAETSGTLCPTMIAGRPLSQTCPVSCGVCSNSMPPSTTETTLSPTPSLSTSEPTPAPTSSQPTPPTDSRCPEEDRSECTGSDIIAPYTIFDACTRAGSLGLPPYAVMCARTCCYATASPTLAPTPFPTPFPTPSPTLSPAEATCLGRSLPAFDGIEVDLEEASLQVGHMFVTADAIRSAMGVGDMDVNFKLSWASDRLFSVDNDGVTLGRDFNFDFETGTGPYTSDESPYHPDAPSGRREFYVDVAVNASAARRLVRRQSDCASLPFGNACSGGCTNDYTTLQCRSTNCFDITQEGPCTDGGCQWFSDYYENYDGDLRGACAAAGDFPSCGVFIVRAQCENQENDRCAWRSSRRCVANTVAPTTVPTSMPTSSSPTASPTPTPSHQPTTSAPTPRPTTGAPTRVPTINPTANPTAQPTRAPVVPNPTVSPTLIPSSMPTNSPASSTPTMAPTTSEPSAAPTTTRPTPTPTRGPTRSPTEQPECWSLDRCQRVATVGRPTCIDLDRLVCVENDPEASCPNGGNWQRICSAPTVSPTPFPSASPVSSPTLSPTDSPTSSTPTVSPTSSEPTAMPSSSPSMSTINPNVVTAVITTTTVPATTTTAYNEGYGFRYFGNDPDYVRGGPPDTTELGCDAVIRIKITLTDANDNRPQIHIDNTEPDIEVSEGATLGAVVFDFGARVSDLDSGDVLTFGFIDSDGSYSGLAESIAEGSELTPTDGPFTINPETGVIYVAQTLDREQVESYTIAVMANDQTGLGAAISLTVYVTDENDNPPTFTAALEDATIAEDTAPGTLVATFSATDPDAGSNGEVYYSAVPATLFNINTNGDLFLIGDLAALGLDFDASGNASLDVIVEATDGGTRSAFHTVSVRITDVNNHAPSFSMPTYSVVVDEGISSEFYFDGLVVTDADSAIYGPITLSITSVAPTQLDTSYFRIDGVSRLVLTQALDFETLPFGNATVTVTATDTGGMTGTATVLFLVTNVNDEKPELSSAVALPSSPFLCGGIVTVSELDNAGIPLLRLTYTDTDSTNEAFTYRMTPESGEFAIADSQGSAVVSLASALNREVVDRFFLVIIATDSGGRQSDPCAVNIRVSDQSDVAPVFTASTYTVVSLHEVNVAANAIPVVTVTATDEDTIDAGLVRYAFDTAEEPAAAFFAIDPVTGVITVMQGVTIDRDASVDGFDFAVKATDSAGNVGRAQVVIRPIIDIDDNVPEFYLRENSNGRYRFDTEAGARYRIRLVGEGCPDGSEICAATTVIQVAVRDPDADTTVFSIVNSPDSSFFEIDSATGLITLTRGLDYEISPSYTFDVLAAGAELTATATIDLTIDDKNDNAPEFDSPVYRGSVAEDALPGVRIMSVITIDVDTDNTVSYNVPQDVSDTFEFVGDSLFVKGALDYEAQSMYSFQIIATDQAGNEDMAMVIITIEDTNDEAPVFAGEAPQVVVSDAAPGTINLFTIVADDADTSPVFSDLSYSIEDVSPSSVAFEIRSPNAVSGTGINRVVGLKSQLGASTGSTGSTFQLEVEASNGADPNWIRAREGLCQTGARCRSTATVEVVPFVAPYTLIGDATYVIDASKVQLDWRMPIDPCLPQVFSLDNVARPAECPTIRSTPKYNRVYSRHQTTFCADSCVETAGGWCECMVGMSTDVDSMSSTNARAVLAGLKGDTAYEFQLRIVEEGLRGRNFSVYTSNWNIFETADYEIKSAIANIGRSGTLVQWASPSESNGVFNNIVVCWTSGTTREPPTSCDGGVDGRATLMNDATEHLIEQTDVNYVMVERVTVLPDGFSYTRITATAQIGAGVDLSEQSTDSSNSEDDRGMGSNLWTILVVILAVIFVAILVAYIQPKLKKQQSVDLNSKDIEGADEIAMETLRNRLFSDDDDEVAPVPAADGAADQDRFWDYYTSERANQFYPEGASQPTYSAGDNASAYLDTKPLPTSAPGSPGGYSRSSVNYDPAPLDLPSQTPRTQRKDGFVAAYQGMVRTPTTYDVAEIPAKVSQVLSTEEVMLQFDGIREEEQHNRSTFIEANQPYNRGKNRYMNVKAIDSSRVKLSGGSNPGDDYINANFVDGWRRPGAYIATQGPVPESFPHFWQMIWEQNCSTIVMVTKEIEMGRLKCHQYWPNAQDAMDAGAFQVISDVEDRSDPAVLLRKFKLKKNATGEVRDVSHLQMLSWPDQNTPETPQDFLDFLNKVRELQGEGDAKGQTGPAVVHCSAGIGRSGTYMMLDTALKRMDQIGNVDACSSVKHMRSQRHGSVQTLAQYRFIYEAIDFYAQNVALSARPGTSLATGPLSASERASIKALADQSSGVAADRLLRQIQALR